MFLLIGAGALLHRTFKFEMNTLSKVTTYFLMPAVGFVNIYESNIAVGLLIEIIGFLLLQNVSLIILSTVVSKVCNFDMSLSSSFKNSIVLNNSGNYGLPVSQLVFQNQPLGSYPTSRNSALFALEYNNHPEYAAQTVLVSTIISSFTVTFIIYISRLIF
jgi:hypothetical protein